MKVNMPNKIDQRDIFLKGENVILKALTREDVIFSGWYGWFNDEVLCKTLQRHYFPTNKESQIEFWEQNIKNVSDRLQLGICRIGESKIIGIVSLNSIDFINRKAEFSAVIGENDARNVIIFIESCKLLFNHGFYSLNLSRIYGGSISKDLVQMMCRMLNCQEEGVKRQDVYKNGKYLDVHCYGLLREEFSQLPIYRD